MSGIATAVAGGRRREALLRHHADREREQRLSAADVEVLQRDRSPHARAQVAAKFGRQFDELCGAADRAIADAVLELLVRDLAVEVRQALADTVAASTRLPPHVARQLAGDWIEVADPILERSPVLSDEDLVRVVRTNAMQYALAVAGRERLSELVSDALVDTGQCRGGGASGRQCRCGLSQTTMQRVVQDYRGNEQIHARVIRRPELPLRTGRATHRRDGRTAGVGADPRPAAVGRGGASADARRSRTRGDQLHGARPCRWQAAAPSANRVQCRAAGPRAALRCLRDGDVASLEIGLGLHARLELNHVRRLLYHADRRHLAGLCLAAGFATPHYLTLRMALEIAEEAMAPRAGNKGYSSDTVRFLQAQYEKLRGDEAKLRLLLGN